MKLKPEVKGFLIGLLIVVMIALISKFNEYDKDQYKRCLKKNSVQVCNELYR